MELTPVGAQILSFAESMEGAVIDIEDGTAGVDKEMRGVVRIVATEGIGGYWLAPKLATFQRRNPGLVIKLDTRSAPTDLTRRDADIAIWYSHPDSDSYTWHRIGSVQARLFASNSYLREHGMPQSVEDLKNHHFVDFEDRPKNIPREEWYAIIEQSNGAVFRTNSSYAIPQAVLTGLGIGLMPTYVADRIHQLKEIPVSIEQPVDLYLVSRADRQQLRRVRVTLNFLHKLFDLDRYKYFSD